MTNNKNSNIAIKPEQWQATIVTNTNKQHQQRC